MRGITNRAMIAGLLLVVSTASSHAAGTAGIEAPQRLPFNADVEVDEKGAVQAGEVRGIVGGLQKIVATQLSTLKLQPGRRGGEIQVARSQLSGEAVLTPAPNDEYEISLGSLQVTPRVYSQPLPRYPPVMAREGRSGSVLLEVRIGVDGRVVSAQALQSTRREFSDTVLNSAKQWVFEPQWLAGKPVEVFLQWPVIFRMETCTTFAKCIVTDIPSIPPSGFDCKWDESRPRMTGQATCADAMEIRGSRVRRRGGGGQIEIP